MDPVQLSQSAVNVAVGGLVLALTQSTKRWTPEGWGPIIAAVWTTLATLVYFVSQPDWPPPRSVYFDILAVWVSVYTAALGLYSAAMIPSDSRQSIGAATNRDGNLAVGETAPKPRRKAPSDTIPVVSPKPKRVRPSRAKPSAVVKAS
jgi:hypothetical protein